MRNLSRVWSPRAAATTLAIILVVGGVAAIGVSYADRQSPPPRPAPSSAGRIASPTATASPPTSPARSAATTTTQPSGPRPSPPIRISIPSIGVQSTIVGLGRNADGSVEVPTSYDLAGWYKYGVTPGQRGPSIFLGHVDSVSGPGVFYRLGSLRPGDRVKVTRRDGRVVTFAITGVRQYPKAAFPTIEVYSDTPRPTIRLVTCGGDFDSATRHYVSNVVAFGEQI